MKILLYASILLYCTTLHHFYDINGVAGLNWKKIGSFIEGEYQDGKGYGVHKKKISKLHAAKDKRLKIALVLMCGSELRISSISELKITSLEPVSKYGTYKITV